MISISLLTEDNFSVNENGHHVYDFYPNRTFEGELHVCPYYPENHDGIEYYRAFLWAEKHNIRIVSYGSKNLLPFLGTISHKAVVSPAGTETRHFNFFLKTAVLSDTRGNFVTNTIDLTCYNPAFELSCAPVFIKRPAPAKVLASKIKSDGPRVYLNGEIIYGCIDYAERHGISIEDNDLQSYGQLSGESPSCTKLYPTLDITEEEIFTKYCNPTLFVDTGAYRDFLGLKENFQRDKLWVEIKPYAEFEAANDLFDAIPDDVVLKRTLREKPLQKELWNRYPDSFLTIQLLSSALLNYQFAGFSGAANLFAMMPFNSFLLVSCDKPLFQMKELKARLQEHQYGTRPHIYIVRTDEAWQKRQPWRSYFEDSYPFLHMRELLEQEEFRKTVAHYRPAVSQDH